MAQAAQRPPFRADHVGSLLRLLQLRGAQQAADVVGAERWTGCGLSHGGLLLISIFYGNASG